MSRGVPKASETTPHPEPGETEKAEIAAASARRKERRPRIAAKLDKHRNGLKASPDHSDIPGWSARLCDAFGSTSPDFISIEISRIITALNVTDESGTPSLNAALATLDGLQPKDEIEAMLASQMATTHAFVMKLLGRAGRAEDLEQFDSAGKMADRLLRTYTMQVDALAKLRRGGQQTVRVEHVHVHPGGQAVVGNVTQLTRGRGVLDPGNQPHAIAHAQCATLPNQDTARDALPITINAKG